MAKKEKELELNIDENIQIIDDPVDAVRRLPDVYIGALNNKGFMNMYREILQNSLDQISKGNTTNKNIVVYYDQITHLVSVSDNGPGIPLELLIQVFSVLHSSSNYDKTEGSGKYSSGKLIILVPHSNIFAHSL